MAEREEKSGRDKNTDIRERYKERKPGKLNIKRKQNIKVKIYE